MILVTKDALLTSFLPHVVLAPATMANMREGEEARQDLTTKHQPACGSGCV